jgi:AcrR family transcriptional regulator
MERVLTAKGAATRARIVEGAAALVREQGVANVGLDDIRAATATSKSQLFHYFPDGKSDLLLAVAQHEADQILAEQQPLLGDLTSWRKWQAWRRRISEIYDGQRAGCPLSALTAQLRFGNPEIQRIVTGLYDRWRDFLADGIRALRASGEIDGSIDPEQSAVSILAAITGGATLLIATDRLCYLEIALADALDDLRRPGQRTRRRISLG